MLMHSFKYTVLADSPPHYRTIDLNNFLNIFKLQENSDKRAHTPYVNTPQEFTNAHFISVRANVLLNFNLHMLMEEKIDIVFVFIRCKHTIYMDIYTVYV